MWRLPGMIGDHRDVVAIDVRGTGPLGAIDCPDLQDGTSSYEEWAAAVDACGAQLGDASDDYGPVDRALDVEAVARLWATTRSSTTASRPPMDVQAYAARFPERLAAVILDSGSAVNDLDGTWLGVGGPPGLLDVVAAECAQHAHCREATPDPRAEVAALVEALAAPDADVDQATVLSIIDGGESADLVPATVAYAAGDHQPLLALAALFPPGDPDESDPADPADLSIGDNFAGTCDDVALPYDVADPVEVRRRTVSDYLDQLPDDVFAPWTKEQWTAFYYAPYICVGWPIPGHHEAVLPAGMTFPEIPALILAGQLEPTASLSEKLLDVFPNGEFYVVPGAHHATLSIGMCAAQFEADWIDGAAPADGPCPGDDIRESYDRNLI